MRQKTRSLRRPIVMYNVTEHCQLRCKHCYNDSGHRFSGACVAPPDERLMADVNKLCGLAGAINFTGGEPFLSPVLPQLLTTAHHHGVDTIITTNGLRILEKDGPSLLGRIEEHVYMIKVGMMGASAETNDWVRGSGNFQVALTALERLGHFDLVSCIKVSLDRHNMHEIERLAELAVSRQVDQIVFGQLLCVGRAGTWMKELVLSPDDICWVCDKIEQVRTRFQGGVKIALHCTLSGLCGQSGTFYTVTAQGSVSPCLMREDLAVGDLGQGDVGELFRQVDAVRSKVRTHRDKRDIPQQGLSEGVGLANRADWFQENL